MNSNINEIKIGHWTDKENKTGCTAIISDVPLIASIDITRIFSKIFAF
jgi:L-aminopeptidase/D-esterase-like protein